MDFEWDSAKSDACYAERGFDFAYAARAFFDPDRDIRQNTRYPYGEDRYQLAGHIEDRLFIVLYTVRKGTIRIVSARKANQREVKHHENGTNQP